MAATDEQGVTVPPALAETSPDTRASKAGNMIKKIRNHPRFRAVLVVLIVLAAIGGILYWDDLQSKVYIENAQITAPVISINPLSPGIINEVDVAVGDTVRKDQVLAKVGNEILLAKTRGVITGIENNPGQLVTPGLDPRPVISMIDTRQLRVTGRVQEDKGLKDIHAGQYVEFTVDAFPDSRYQGVVEKVAPAARVGDIVFSISDKRQEQEFDVTVSYDVSTYPELKDGMSAKMWIFK
jgi:multidrug resistance efflux pump